MKLFLAALILAAALWSQSVPVYKNPDAPIEKRVEDLLSRMTLEEKVSQMMNASSAIERLDVPAYNWCNEYRPGRHLGHRPGLPHSHRHLRRSPRQVP